MNAFYVEYSRERLLATKAAFDRRAVMFMADYRTRRLQALQDKKSKSIGGFFTNKMEQHAAAERAFATDPAEVTLFGQITDGLTALRELFVAAELAPAGTKFYVPLDEARWFAEDNARM
ncbi:hypothetical protein [Hyphomicrobium sp.]|uniref:hypothetical protein n=1 Tax=Hyphomicrobium sp. TaxID=82 RepID=UPI001D2CDB43|nr:hypothetical protein [Hyphomicrobium sp.]MBY0560150.1 hypothetical protein [Hyphomicrobium sp.]